MQQNILDGLYEICSSNRDFRQYRLERYIKFIDSRKNREIPEGTYTERHHILPRSYIRKLRKLEVDFEIPSESFKEESNVVLLTGGEHFIAHWMLARISNCQGMKKGLFRLCKGSKIIPRRNLLLAEKLFSETVRGSKIFYNPETYERKRVPRGETPPVGWINGFGKRKPRKLGRNWFHDPETLSSGQFIDGNQPVGWILGFGNGMGKSYYHDPKTCVTKKFKRGSEPIGWVLGKPKSIKRSSSIKGKSWFYDPKTFQRGVFADGQEPTDWVKGRIGVDTGKRY